MAWRCGVVLLILGLSFHASEAGPVSGDGCPCTSTCAKSWLNGGDEWCYVGKQCKPAGWDSCHDAAMLYSKGNDKEEKTTESESLWQRLQNKLKQTQTKEVEEKSALTKLQEKSDTALKVAEQEVALAAAETKKEKHRRLEGEAALAAAEAKLKKTQQHISEQESNLAVVTKHEADVEAELATTHAQLKTSQAQLKTSQLMEDTSKKQLRSALEKEEKSVREAQQKADDAEAKGKEEHAKVMTWETTHHKDLATHQTDALELSDTQLRLSGKEKQLFNIDKEANEAYTKLNIAEKAMLKVKAQASEAEKKLAASLSENAHLKDVEKKYIDVQQKLEASEQKKHELSAQLRPLHDAIRKAVMA